MMINRCAWAMLCTMALLACSKQPSSQAATGNAQAIDNSIPATQALTSAADSKTKQPPANENKNANTAYTTIEWTDLLPEEDLEALSNPPDYLNEIDDGSLADAIDGQIKANPTTPNNDQTDPKADRYQQALVSKAIKSEFNNRAIRIPGFIVPLEFDDTLTMTTFFLVPFFGACIHVPPPPPNQIIYAEYEPGIRLEELYDAFWIEGTLTTTLIENEMATAAYSMTVTRITPYHEDD